MPFRTNPTPHLCIFAATGVGAVIPFSNGTLPELVEWYAPFFEHATWWVETGTIRSVAVGVVLEEAA